MSFTTKFIPHSLIGIVSVLPALLVMPAFADTRIVLNEDAEYADGFSLSGVSTEANGGAMSVNNISTATFNGSSSFTNNSATNVGGLGGAIFINNNGASPELNEMVFSGPATFNGNTAYSGGGALYSEGIIVFNDTATFTGNKTTDAANASGAGIGANAMSDITFTGAASFTNNGADGNTYGGAGIANEGTMTFLDTATFTGNVATGSGSAFANGGTMVFQKGLTATGNKDTVDLQVIGHANNGAISNGGVLSVYGGDINISNNTAAGKAGIQNNGTVLFGAYKEGLSTVKAVVDNITFKDNTATNGHAAAIFVHENSTATELYGNNILFQNNDSTGANVNAYSGAIWNDDKLIIEGANITFKDNDANGTTTNNADLYKFGGGAIQHRGYNQGASQLTIGLEDGSSNILFENNTSKTNGGALHIRNKGAGESAVTMIRGKTTFTENHADLNGGAISHYLDAGTSTLTLSGNSTFTGNTAGQNGGAIYNKGTLTLSDTVFGGNRATLGNRAIEGGAIYNNGTLTFSNATTFANNVASNSDGNAFGGAIENYYGDLTFNGLATFTNNSVYCSGAECAAQGGALHNLSATTTFNDGAIFSGNTTSSNGAAIYNGLNHVRAGIVNLNGNSLFENNTAAEDNGIVFNVANADIDNTIAFADGDATFRGNTGVSLWNQDLVTFTNMGNVLFENNRNTAGAGSNAVISNGGTMTIETTNFTVQNNTSSKGAVGNTSPSSVFDLTATNVNFTNNVGGAIYKENDSFSITATEKIAFVGNTSNMAAAVNNNGNYSQTTLEASEILFSGNVDSASYGGAIFNSGDFVEILADKVTFKDNKANGTTSTESDMVKYGGGAIQNRGNKGSHQVTTIVIGNDADSVVVFENNSSAMHGGAIHARAEKAATNTAAADAGSVSINGTATFSANTAALNGGAISNSPVLGTSDFELNGNTTFQGNRAGGLGGAVYNSGTMVFDGSNTFTGNTDSTGANDIYNTGTITFNGNTTLDGGITGTGTVAIAAGKTLNIGTASIEQGTLTLNGNVNGYLLSSTDFASFDVATFSGTGTINLTLKGVGEYTVFANDVFDTGSVNVEGSSVFTYNWNDAKDTITVATKSVNEIVAATNVKAETATTVVTLANANDTTAQEIGRVLGAALAEGDTDYVEQETKKLSPEDKPVTHSVASSVQNQVLSLTSNRMSGGMAAGRSGGDEIEADYGAWAQGLYNKTRYLGKFDGHSAGVAVGFDALIEKVYTVGLGYSYSNGDITSSDGRDIDIDSNTVFVYGQYKPSNWFINATFSNTVSNYTEKAIVAGLPVETKYDVNAFGIQTMTGYDFASGVTPTVGLRYLHVSTDGYDTLPGYVGDMNSTFVSAVGGLKYAFEIQDTGDIRWAPEFHAMATYDVISDKNGATVYVPGGTSYHIAGDRMSRAGAELGLGLTAEWRGLEMSLNYDLQMREDYLSHTGMLKLRYEF